MKLKFVLLFLSIWLASCAKQPISANTHDLLLINGTLFDGSDKAGKLLDIAITGDKITFIGDAKHAEILARETIDVSGLIVAPGFIDPHTHTIDDLSTAETSSNLNYLTQGVTTVITGNDGRGPIEIFKTLEKFKQVGIGTNAGLLAGHGTIRQNILGKENRAPDLEELKAMQTMLSKAMSEGAFGLSTGLYYVPGSYAETDEIIELTKVLKTTGGIYESHIRDESTYTVGLKAAVEEVIQIGQETTVPVHVSHIKALGVDVWDSSDDIIEMVNNARSNGIQITADQYPWSASGTGIANALIPNWAKADSTELMHQRLQDQELTKKLNSDIKENLRIRGGAKSLLITDGNPDYIGKTLEVVAQEIGMSEVETAKFIVLNGDARVASFNMQESDIENFMQQPWVMTSSDGSKGHPRKYGSFPRKYNRYVLDRKVIDLAEFIHKSSGLTADTFDLCNRGYLRADYFADLIVFNPDEFSEKATFSEPKQLSKGIVHVIVNGQAAIKNSTYTEIKNGRPLKRGNCPK